MPVTIKNYADVQNALTALVNVNGLPVGQAPHGAFWNSLTYDQFVNGNVPGQIPGGPYKILVVGNSAASNIIMALSGTAGSPFDPNTGIIGQMPQPNPPYNSAPPTQSDIIAALSQWIDNKCPNNA